jgi:hypothetical protein
MIRDVMAVFLVQSFPLLEAFVDCFVMSTHALLRLPVCFGMCDAFLAIYV